jgi:hypothetical protein
MAPGWHRLARDRNGAFGFVCCVRLLTHLSIFFLYFDATIRKRFPCKLRNSESVMVPQPPEFLVQRLRERQCILFVGSGLSTTAHLPMWSDPSKR